MCVRGVRHYCSQELHFQTLNLLFSFDDFLYSGTGPFMTPSTTPPRGRRAECTAWSSWSGWSAASYVSRLWLVSRAQCAIMGDQAVTLQHFLIIIKLIKSTQAVPNGRLMDVWCLCKPLGDEDSQMSDMENWLLNLKSLLKNILNFKILLRKFAANILRFWCWSSPGHYWL